MVITQGTQGSEGPGPAMHVPPHAASLPAKDGPATACVQTLAWTR
jgi:hypothetical protein